jgi:hypothetical protein
MPRAIMESARPHPYKLDGHEGPLPIPGLKGAGSTVVPSQYSTSRPGENSVSSLVRKDLSIRPLSLLMVKSSERPGAVQGARFLRGAANPGRRGPFWNIGRKGKGARRTHSGDPGRQGAGASTAGRYTSFLHRTAHAVRTNLFARATIATFWWVRGSSWASQALRAEDCLVLHLMTARAPCTNSLRRYTLPCLLMPSSLCLPPVEHSRGTIPTQAAKSRPLRNPAPLPIAATRCATV